MNSPEIIRVWGTADAFDIEFTKKSDGRWYATVLPDLNDGQYAVGIHAINEYGETAYWAGILYMLTGEAHFHIEKEDYVIWGKPQNLSISLCPEKYIITVNRRRCNG